MLTSFAAVISTVGGIESLQAPGESWEPREGTNNVRRMRLQPRWSHGLMVNPFFFA